VAGSPSRRRETILEAPAPGPSRHRGEKRGPHDGGRRAREVEPGSAAGRHPGGDEHGGRDRRPHGRDGRRVPPPPRRHGAGGGEPGLEDEQQAGGERRGAKVERVRPELERDAVRPDEREQAGREQRRPGDEPGRDERRAADRERRRPRGATRGPGDAGGEQRGRGERDGGGRYSRAWAAWRRNVRTSSSRSGRSRPGSQRTTATPRRS
jgi:hypothetical protein